MNQTQMNFTTSNLSKIKPKLRTQGNVTGNFGKSKVKAGSPIQSLGVTKVKDIKITTQNEYLKKMYKLFNFTNDPEMMKFAYVEIRKILIQRGVWNNQI